MRRRKCGHVLAEAASAAGCGLEMANEGIGTEMDRPSRRSPAVRELALEVIGSAHEVLIEPALLEREVPIERKVAAHESVDLPRLRRSEGLCLPRCGAVVDIP